MSDDRKDLPPVNSPNFLEKVREALSVYLGNRGNALDRGITVRDLTESGIANFNPNYRNGTGNFTPPVIAPDNSLEIDLTPPPTPTGFMASAGVSNVLVETANPVYSMGGGHQKTRIYGSTLASPVFGDASLLAEFPGNVGSYATNPATTWHLWATWVSNDGVESLSPAGGTNGVVVTTGQDVTTLLDALAGEISASELDAVLTGRVNQIDDAATGLNKQHVVKLDVAGQIAGYGLASTKPAPLTVDYVAFQSAVSKSLVGIEPELSLLDETFSGRKLGDVNNSGTVDIGDLTDLSSYNAGSLGAGVSLTYLTTILPPLLLADTKKYAAYLKTDTAIVTQFGVRADRFYIGPPAVVSTTAPSANLFNGYTWLDISGATAVLKYYNGSSFGTTPTALPFVVQTTPTTVGGVAVDPGVYIRDAYIKNGTITNAKIADATIDNAKIVNLTATKLTTGTLAVGADISSTSFVPGSSGWRIQGNGTAEFSGVIVRGTIYATAGLIGGITIATDSIRYGQTAYNTGTGFWLGNVSGVSKFSLGNSAGNTLTWDGTNLNIVGGGTFSGALSAATGSFAGSLSAATGSFAGTLTAAAVNAVNTINIAGNAVTVTSTSSADVDTVTPTMGASTAVTIDGTYPIQIVAYINNVRTTNSATTIYLKRNGTTIKSAFCYNEGASTTTITIIAQETLAAGTYTYTLEPSTWANNNFNQYSTTSTTTINVISVKK